MTDEHLAEWVEHGACIGDGSLHDLPKSNAAISRLAARVRELDAEHRALSVQALGWEDRASELASKLEIAERQAIEAGERERVLLVTLDDLVLRFSAIARLNPDAVVASDLEAVLAARNLLRGRLAGSAGQGRAVGAGTARAASPDEAPRASAEHFVGAPQVVPGSFVPYPEAVYGGGTLCPDGQPHVRRRYIRPGTCFRCGERLKGS